MEPLLSELPWTTCRHTLSSDIYAAPLPSNETILVTYFAVDVEDRIWYATYSHQKPYGLYYFDPMTCKSLVKWEGQVASITAGKDGKILFLKHNESYIACCEGPEAEIRQWYPSPGEWPISIRAARDGTVFFLSDRNRIYQSVEWDKDWVELPEPPATIKEFSPSHEGAIWAVCNVDEEGYDQLALFSKGKWQLLSMENQNTASISGCEDGTALLVRNMDRGDGDFALIVSRISLNGEEKQLYCESSRGTMVGTAVSSHPRRVYFRRIYFDGNRGCELQAFTEGVADLPFEGWPPLSGEEEKAYSDISKRLGLQGKLRDIYNSQREWSIYIGDLRQMNPPKDIDSDKWKKLRDTLVVELETVSELEKLTENIKLLYLRCEVKCIEAFNMVKPFFNDIFKAKHKDLDFPLSLMVDKGINKIALKLPFPYGAVVALIAGPLSKAIAKWTGIQGSGLNPDKTLSLAAAKLEQAYSDLFDRANSSLSEAKASIVTSEQKLLSVKKAIREGDWDWPSQDIEAIASMASIGFRQAIFQALSPVLWKVLVFADWDINRASPTPVTPEPQAPKQAIYSEGTTHPLYKGWLQVNYWVLCGINSPTHPFKMNPFPGKDFMTELGELGFSLSDVAHGLKGWGRQGFHNKGDKQPGRHSPL